MFLVLFLASSILYSQDDQFVQDAQALAFDLRTSLMQNLSEKISKDGIVEAVPFCHENVKSIAKGAAKDRINKYEFGRTSHKVRNLNNKAQPWAIKYLKEFEGTKKSDNKKEYIVHKHEDGERIYLEPLYVEAKCLMCHGDKVSQNVSSRIKKLYPQDEATGFQLGEFRGFIWVRELQKLKKQ